MAVINLPGINPTIQIPGAYMPPGSTTNYVQGPVAPMGFAPPTQYKPLGDWRTPLNLTASWGKIDQPILSQFINPTEYQKTLASLITAPPVYPTTGVPSWTKSWTTSDTTPIWMRPPAPKTPAATMGPVAPTATKLPVQTATPTTTLAQTTAAKTPVSTAKAK